MSEARPARDDQPIGLAQMAADDLLLDALGKGEPPPEPNDQVATLLGAWRADLETDLPAPVETPPAPNIRRFRRPRLSRTLASAAAAVLTVGLGVATHQAGPGSPLWPLTRVVYPQRAEVVAAETAIDGARSAVAAGRYDDARRLLVTAAEHTAHIDDPVAAGRMRVEIDAIQRELAAVTPPASPVPSAPAGPAEVPASTPTPQPAATPAGTEAPGPRQGQTGPTGGAPAPAPPPVLETPLPKLPLPSLNLPSLPPLPSILPTKIPLLDGTD